MSLALTMQRIASYGRTKTTLPKSPVAPPQSAGVGITKGRITETGAKVGIAGGLAGAGIGAIGLGFDFTKNKIEDSTGLHGLGGIIVLAIMGFIGILVLRRVF